ncbi:MAG: cobalamin-binding protein [Nitrospirota bacterium]
MKKQGAILKVYNDREDFFMRLKNIAYGSFFLFLMLHLYHPASFAAQSQTIRLTDAAGRTINLARPATRIVSLAPSITEILFALGLNEEIVGVTPFCDYPPEAREKPKVGGFVSPNFESLVALRPDLILGIKDLQGPELVDELDRLRLPAYFTDPSSVKQILDEIMNIGKLTGRDAQALALVNRMKERIDKIRRKINGHHYPKVLYIFWNDPLMTIGRGSFIAEIIDLAGGKNIGPKDRKGYFLFNLEEVLVKNPDVLIFASEMGENGVAAEQKRWKQWTHLSAVKNNRLYSIDSNLLHRPGPRIVDALETLASLLHPELFKGTGEIE